VIDAYYVGKAYLDISEPDKAIKTLERGVNYLTENKAYDPFYSVRCHYLLGQAYERSGQKDNATEQYKKFLDIWKDAAPDIPEIDEARKRLTALGA
jgi:tetratricopeptide (TPR) repeat protein